MSTDQERHDDRVSLEKYLTTRLEDHRLLDEAKHQAMAQALELATAGLEKRYNQLNNLHAAMDKFLLAEVYETAHRLLVADVEDLRISRARSEGRASMAAVFGGTALLLAIIDLIMRLIGR